MKLLRYVLLAVIAACLVGVLWLRTRDPESITLSDSARSSAPGLSVRLSDGVTHYDVSGPDSGARVVLVHGFSVPMYIWDSTAVALANAGFRVLRYDTYGRGWSDRPDVSYDLELYDRQLVDLLDSLTWRDPVHLVGLSFGGPVTATFVSRHPERVRSLSLIDPAAEKASVPAMFSVPGLGPLLWQGLAVPTMASGQATDFVEPARWPDWSERYRDQQQYRGFGRALLRTLVAVSGTSLDSLYATAGRTGRPTLLVWGEADSTVPISNAAAVQRAIPQAQFHPIPKAGHLPHMERTDLVNPLLIGFLRAN